MAGSEETMTCLTSVQAQLTSSDWRCWREISEPSGAHARHTVEDRVNKQSAAMTPCCQLKGLVLATRLVPGQGADTALRPDVSQVFDDNTSLMAEAFSHGQWVNAGSLSASYDALQRLRERLISGLKCGVAALERPAFAKSVLTRPDVIDCKAPLFGDHTSAPPPLDRPITLAYSRAAVVLARATSARLQPHPGQPRIDRPVRSDCLLWRSVSHPVQRCGRTDDFAAVAPI